MCGNRFRFPHGRVVRRGSQCRFVTDALTPAALHVLFYATRLSQSLDVLIADVHVTASELLTLIALAWRQPVDIPRLAQFLDEDAATTERTLRNLKRRQL